MLFIEYDVLPNGQIELVALINAVEERGEDEDGSAWMAWRSTTFEDGGLGCVGVPPDQLTLMEGADAETLRAAVERLILADRTTKEASP